MLECVVVGRVVVVVVTAARQFVHNSRRGVFQYVFLKVFLTMVTLFLQVSVSVSVSQCGALCCDGSWVVD